jgi:hypothetical protein
MILSRFATLQKDPFNNHSYPSLVIIAVELVEVTFKVALEEKSEVRLHPYCPVFA